MRPADIRRQGWQEEIELGRNIKALLYSDGEIGISHECHLPRSGYHVWAAPVLATGHSIVSMVPLTITPSFLCEECQLHGFITDGKWVQA